ncbi:MAG: excinuclease ABC subunit C [Chloroflexi bacterium GWB2_49_20]|nr:MAG: excinuclease ABC subunit C [Chloroflexi bacterium GWB2_49_20]OGN76691.1 MAG: excinuclease ABC subunit C [Chloroflexi bacterium GWC2_49_37]OGN83651.1 MAG: excinuclease ABC subunit C [Chloroflexi bacterium GWD2_49_16]HBG74227.1 excinuclease ABC subunit C [Anaerolineae bacterium]HCC78956.1 excinuclease ABC subunit C [Anaerolineae bacterium]
MEISDHLKGILSTLPDKPGCYIMKNTDGKIIYVGKAINLKNRVRSYFHNDTGYDHKTRRLVKDISDLEWILVGSELEALILEMNLIKRHRPHYNIRMKDDKRYPYIKVHWAQDFPKVTVTRQMQEDGARYFGPYTSAWAVHQTLDVLRRIFPYLTCDREITGKDARACLYHDIKLCTAPCIGAIDREGYRQVISDLQDFLNGHSEGVLARLHEKMELASQSMQFERAAVLRDQLKALGNIIERQKVVFASDYVDSDVIAMARANNEACVQVFFIRGGKLIGREYFILEGTEDTRDPEVIAEFIKQFYTEAAFIPGQVLLPQEIEEAQIIQQWLRGRSGGHKVEMVVPHQGQPHELVKMAAENAAETLHALRVQWQADTHRQEQSLADLQKALKLAQPPNRIECYDISNTQGTASVGSMVVFSQGVPDKKLYRRFNIETVSGPDDFASMEEVLTRRFRRWQAAQGKELDPGSKPDTAFSILPDVLIVDGGKGQLGRAVRVLDKYTLLDKVTVVGLAKQEEELFFPNRSKTLVLPRQSQGLYLIQRIRDEAHRFAITAHRKKRTRQGLASALDTIPGIGPARRKALLKYFGSVDMIKAATPDELISVPGITLVLAESIKAHLE